MSPFIELFIQIARNPYYGMPITWCRLRNVLSSILKTLQGKELKDELEHLDGRLPLYSLKEFFETLKIWAQSNHFLFCYMTHYLCPCVLQDLQWTIAHTANNMLIVVYYYLVLDEVGLTINTKYIQLYQNKSTTFLKVASKYLNDILGN